MTDRNIDTNRDRERFEKKIESMLIGGWQTDRNKHRKREREGERCFAEQLMISAFGKVVFGSEKADKRVFLFQKIFILIS